jgi:hypothetical protein
MAEYTGFTSINQTVTDKYLGNNEKIKTVILRDINMYA